MNNLLFITENNYAGVFVVLLIVAIIFFFAWLFAQGKVSKEKKRYSELYKDHNEEIETRNKKLKRKDKMYDALKAEKEGVEKDFDTLSGKTLTKLDVLESELDGLRELKKKREAQITKLSEKHKELARDYKKLEKDYNKLCEESTNLRTFANESVKNDELINKFPNWSGEKYAAYMALPTSVFLRGNGKKIVEQHGISSATYGRWLKEGEAFDRVGRGMYKKEVC